jgi:uncharacterized membrane protein
MAEEVKQEEKKLEAKKVMSTIFKVVLGIVFLVAAVYLLVKWQWWRQTWLLVKGCAGPFLILAGLITLAIAKE